MTLFSFWLKVCYQAGAQSESLRVDRHAGAKARKIPGVNQDLFPRIKNHNMPSSILSNHGLIPQSMTVSS